MATKRQQLLELEQIVENELSSENSDVEVRCGYDKLSKYLHEERDLGPSVNSRAYRYWTFLTLLRIVADPDDFEEESVVLFSPESGTQSGGGPRLFVEPSLPKYSKEELLSKSSRYTHLQDPTENGTIHHVPNKIITKSKVDQLPWSADRGLKPKDRSELLQMCASGEYGEVANLLGTDTIPSSYKGCSELVDELAEKEDSPTISSERQIISENVAYLIDCNHGSLSKNDYSKILWYGIAYTRPLIIVTSEQITDKAFKKDLERLPTKSSVVENFSTDLGPSDSLNKLKQIIR